jgi:hypothetical protein
MQLTVSPQPDPLHDERTADAAADPSPLPLQPAVTPFRGTGPIVTVRRRRRLETDLKRDAPETGTEKVPRVFVVAPGPSATPPPTPAEAEAVIPLTAVAYRRRRNPLHRASPARQVSFDAPKSLAELVAAGLLDPASLRAEDLLEQTVRVWPPFVDWQVQGEWIEVCAAFKRLRRELEELVAVENGLEQLARLSGMASR